MTGHAFESLGGWHMAAVKEVKKIAQAMARQTGLVESKAGLPCLAFFGQKRAFFVPFSAIFGSCQ